VRTTSDLRSHAAAAAAAAASASGSPRVAAPRLPPSPLGRPTISPPHSPAAAAGLEAEGPDTPQGASPRPVVCRICEEAIHPDVLERHSQVGFAMCRFFCIHYSPYLVAVPSPTAVCSQAVTSYNRQAANSSVDQAVHGCLVLAHNASAADACVAVARRSARCWTAWRSGRPPSMHGCTGVPRYNSCIHSYGVQRNASCYAAGRMLGGRMLGRMCNILVNFLQLI
jgi:hypothetical protein